LFLFDSFSVHGFSTRPRKHGLLWRPILVTKSQLDQLGQRGYLDPGRRGHRADECDAVEIFLADALPKSTRQKIGLHRRQFHHAFARRGKRSEFFARENLCWF
jgi:hypothetical protein